MNIVGPSLVEHLFLILRLNVDKILIVNVSYLKLKELMSLI